MRLSSPGWPQGPVGPQNDSGAEKRTEKAVLLSSHFPFLLSPSVYHLGFY